MRTRLTLSEVQINESNQIRPHTPSGRNYVMRRMREFDLEPRVDPAGNIFGARAGFTAELETDSFRLTHRLGTERW
jgi:hypothetical protein